MRLSEEKLRMVVRDLGLNIQFEKGKRIPIKNCWHFCTDGNATDVLFYDEEDFIDGMNRIYLLALEFDIVILAFCLMDNHIHFCIYGRLEDCKAFMHEYMRLLSMRIHERHGASKKCAGIPVNYQVIDNDLYLKTVICYIIKNAPSAGLPFTAYDYPWGSGALYFRKKGLWTSPSWTHDRHDDCDDLGVCRKRELLKSKKSVDLHVSMVGKIISPEEYIPVEVVEKIFKTAKSYSFFLNYSKEEDVESNNGLISRLSIPDSELRQHKRDLCKTMFGVESTYNLNTKQRLKLAKVLRSKFNCSAKQVSKISGLVYSEVKDLL